MPERYDVMSGGYEQKQAELRQELKSITEHIREMDMREMYEKLEKYSCTAGNPIVIHYTFQLSEQNGTPAIEQVMRSIQQTA